MLQTDGETTACATYTERQTNEVLSWIAKSVEQWRMFAKIKQKLVFMTALAVLAFVYLIFYAKWKENFPNKIGNPDVPAVKEQALGQLSRPQPLSVIEESDTQGNKIKETNLFPKENVVLQQLQELIQQQQQLASQLQKIQQQTNQSLQQIQQLQSNKEKGTSVTTSISFVSRSNAGFDPGATGWYKPRPRPSDLHPDVNIVPSVPDKDLVLPHKDCVPLPRSPRPGVVICIHPVNDDIWVSGALKTNRLWEDLLIREMNEAFQNDLALCLLDVGSNIGEYTLWAAAMGREGVAVEMLQMNVQLLQTSLQLSGLSNNVTIVNNAVYRDHRTLGIKFFKGNIGGTGLDGSSPIIETNKSQSETAVKTVCMDDLLPLVVGKTLLFIKMDIENSEHHALACAHKLFNETNVKIVQMEWVSKTAEAELEIQNFMKLHGYSASKSPVQFQKLLEFKGDLFFLKNSVFQIP